MMMNSAKRLLLCGRRLHYQNPCRQLAFCAAASDSSTLSSLSPPSPSSLPFSSSSLSYRPFSQQPLFDDQNYNNHSSDNNHNDVMDHHHHHHHHHHPSAKVELSEDGTTMTLRIVEHNDNDDNDNDNDESTPLLFSFHAAWLWVQDPAQVHATSGQKLRTLGQYPGTLMDSVVMVMTMIPESNQNNNKNDDDNDSIIMFPYPPPGSFHARGGVYNHNTGDNNYGNHDNDDDDDDDGDGDDDDDQMAAVSPKRQMVQITWASGETSCFDIDWLMRVGSINNNNNNNNNNHHHKGSSSSSTEITPDLAIGEPEKNPSSVPIPTGDYQTIMETNEGLFQAMHGIMEHGAILIQGAPLAKKTNNTNNNVEEEEEEEVWDDSIVADLGRRLSGCNHLSHGSLYGETFHVQAVPNANNIAYTNVALPPHQDLTYYKDAKPFLQLLHCADYQNVDGGASVLIDAMAAVHYLRQVLPPRLFQVLTTVEATFLKQRDGAEMVSFQPHVQMSQDQVVAVHWSPPFEGPLLSLNQQQKQKQLQKPDGDLFQMEDYMMAYQAMECLLDNHFDKQKHDGKAISLPEDLKSKLCHYADQYTWERVLEPGEILVFNNQRMLHGRRGFEFVVQDDETRSSTNKNTHISINETINPRRHLIGCYTDVMETLSHYRLLLRERRRKQATHNGQEPCLVRNAGNGTRGTFL